MNDTPLLRVSGISKRFGATAALSDAHLTLRASEIHALVGANGAGKSTLARIISGNIQPDQGIIEIDGRQVRHANAREAIRDGISIVTQETSLAPDLSIFENIMLPRMAMPGRPRWKAMRRKAADLVVRFGQEASLDLNAPVRSLSIGQRQMVEMLRALALDSRVIIFDEPTAALSPRESARLFDIMRNLAAAGHGLIFVTHRLEELLTVSNRVTVLREGKVMADAVPTEDLSQGEIIRLMVGRELSDIYARRSSGSHLQTGEREVVLSVRNLRAPPRVHDISFDAHRGEILGLAGLVGAGRSEALETIFGLRPAESGEVLLEGKPIRSHLPRASIRAGVGFVPEDRRGQGIIPDFSVKENLLIAHLGARHGALLGYGDRQAEIHKLLGVLGLPVERMLDSNLLNFSGGMQQKVILARWLLLSPRLLLLDEPTKGVDIGTRSSIYTLLREAAAKGVTCVVVSSDFEEIIGLTDRVVVISDGKSVADISSDLINVEKLAMFATPRSSADRTHRVLKMLADRYGGVAFWVRVEDQHVFCFDRVGQDTAADPGFAGGDIPEVANTRIRSALATLKDQPNGFIAENDSPLHTLLVPVGGQADHEDFGFIGLCLAGPPDQVDVGALKREIFRGMAEPTEVAIA